MSNANSLFVVTFFHSSPILQRSLVVVFCVCSVMDICVKFQEESNNLLRITTLHEGIYGVIKYLLVYRMLQINYGI
jgi:hypothetical protein